VPDGWVAVVIDVDDRKRIEETLREADRRKDRFLSMLAHELRNPLAGVQNSLQLMQMRGTDDPLVRQAQEIAQRQTGLLARLVDDLVDVARVTSDKITLRKEPLELAQVITHAAEAARPLLDARGHELSVQLPAEPLHLLADPARLGQILTNLLNNAAKYTDPGGRVTLSAERAGGEVVLRVRDTGVGISAELVPKVFDLFVQADTSLDRSQGGLGIGLTLVKKLAELHGGNVTASSPGPGRGSEFAVCLPALPALPPRAGTAEPASDTKSGSGNGRRVLVVDDNFDGAESLAMMLRLWGYAVRVAHDGPSALAVAEEWLPEAVLCDIGLPGMDGYEVARRLLRLQGMGAGLLVAVSGYGEQEHQRQARAAGFALHLVKPVLADALLDVLGQLEPR
jgi:CheY-like chemotaxis protein